MKRAITTFEAEIDVARGIRRATRAGLSLKFIANNGLRAWLRRKGYLRQRDAELLALTKKSRFPWL